MTAEKGLDSNGASTGPGLGQGKFRQSREAIAEPETEAEP